ncbi:hypothetical protein [Flavobacterium sp.]|uniref:hypothetical protein n=1 Tax=Flavobacterium sp. TaxID=239 RepID=UPI002637F6D3|nr:hypothetical protein [Flavobacterium sp.]
MIKISFGENFFEAKVAVLEAYGVVVYSNTFRNVSDAEIKLDKVKISVYLVRILYKDCIITKRIIAKK